MTIADMLGQSGVLTLLGMGIVFSFLIIMIISITLMGKIVHALGLDKDVAPAKAGSGAPAAGNNAAGSAAGNAAVTAAISAAVNEYRKK
ncbi:MAG: OadG family protein [Treponema sp.]|jgi:oxaloacetate decarboxylase gamma subunit|nr:OadG family protein [Treponema sp.]